MILSSVVRNGKFLPEIGQMCRWLASDAAIGTPHPSQVEHSAVLLGGNWSAGGEGEPILSGTMVSRWGRDTLGEHKVNGRCHMSEQSMTGAPACTWVAVTDASGRTRMEARWTTAASLAVAAA